MKINVTGHHVNVTESLRNYVGSKFKTIERHIDRVTDIHVILSVEKLVHKAEATVQVSGAKIFAEDHQEDMYPAIDALVDKLDRQLLKHKEKVTDHRL